MKKVNFEVYLKVEHVQRFVPVLDVFLATQATHINETGTIIPFTRLKDASSSPGTGNLFRISGEGYEIGFNGKPTFWLAASVGLQYIESLLRNPNTDIHVSQLVTMKAGPYAQEGNVVDPADGLFPDTGIAEGEIDATTYKAVTTTLDELRAELEHDGAGMTPERQADLEDKVRKLERYLRNARIRKKNEQVEKLRIRVKVAITAALSKIRTYDIRLYQYFDAHIQTGTFCRYTPENSSTKWEFER